VNYLKLLKSEVVSLHRLKICLGEALIQNDEIQKEFDSIS
jgi:hypothetical protein